MTVQPGTPPGVGLTMKPPLFLKKGDLMSLGIEALGEQRQVVAPFKRLLNSRSYSIFRILALT